MHVLGIGGLLSREWVLARHQLNDPALTAYAMMCNGVETVGGI
jgi:hypothetical protein